MPFRRKSPNQVIRRLAREAGERNGEAWPLHIVRLGYLENCRSSSREAPVDSVEYVWQRSFFAVLTEVDSERFLNRLVVADDEVFHRLVELEGSVGTNEERLALEDTLQSLRLLRNYDYHFRL
jgi:hypothetical protein